MSTFATLLVVPSIFALVIGKKEARSPSLYPGNPESAYHDPDLDSGGNGEANGRAHRDGDDGGNGAHDEGAEEEDEALASRT
jgi:hypothetical protein